MSEIIPRMLVEIPYSYPDDQRFCLAVASNVILEVYPHSRGEHVVYKNQCMWRTFRGISGDDQAVYEVNGNPTYDYFFRIADPRDIVRYKHLLDKE